MPSKMTSKMSSLPRKPRKAEGNGAKPKKYSCLSCSRADNLQMVCCDNCDGWYHYQCAGVTAAVADVDWRCRTCSELLASGLVESQQTSGGPVDRPISSPVAEKHDLKGKSSGEGAHFPQNGDFGGHSKLQLQLSSSNAPPASPALFQARLSASEPPCNRKTVSDHVPRIAKSTCSAKPKASSSSSLRRLYSEAKFVRQEQSILQQKEALIQQKEDLLRKERDLAARIEEDEDSSSLCDEAVGSCAEVESWLKGTYPGTHGPSEAPHAESTAATQIPTRPHGPTSQSHQQDQTLQNVLDKLRVLELQCARETANASKHEWIPGLVPAIVPSVINQAENSAFANQEQSCVRQITRDQLTARHGVSKDLPAFKGNPDEWPLFIASFEQTTELCGFSEFENLIRLRQALEGPARNAVKNLLLHASCVPQIISTLRMKFGRPELIIDTLLSQIRDMPAPKENRLESIVDFAIEVQNICATMKASSLQNHLNNPELEQELVSKLPGLLGPFWGMYKLTLTSSTLDDFSSWLFQLAQGANNVIIPSTSAKTRRRGTLNTHTEEVHSAKCGICQSDCPEAGQCPTFLRLTRSDKWKTVRLHQLCKRCLKPHYPERCLSTTLCGVDDCQFAHHPCLHNHNKAATTTSSTPQMDCNAHRQDKDPILFRVLPVTLHGNGVNISTYAFLDDGSSVTLIDEDLVAQLGLRGVPQPLCLRWTSSTHRNEDGSQLLDLKISGDKRDMRYTLKDVHTVRQLDLPSQSLEAERIQEQYKYLRGVPLSSYVNAVPKLLIGLNNCRLVCSLRSREGTELELVAEKTRLGWTLKGQLSEYQPGGQKEHHSFHICECDTNEAELLKTVQNYICLDNLGVEQKPTLMSKDDELAYGKLQSLTKRTGNRFQTGLLWKAPGVRLPDSLPMAKRRAKSLQLKLQKDPSLAAVLQSKIEDYVAKGYARKLRADKVDEQDCWYLPVFPVKNPNKPGKVRLVWDAAAKVDGRSLNSTLLKGPDQLASLVSTILKFRQRRIAIGGDIEEMYHQVQIREEDQRYQRFLWFEPGSSEPTTFVMKVMTFGASCSPSCAQYVKNINAKEFQDRYPRAAQCILENHCVDDMLDSVDTEDEAIKLAREVHFIHSRAGFKMRNWVSNSKIVSDALNAVSTHKLDFNVELSTEKVLSMWWSTSDDCFIFKISKRYTDKDVLLGVRRPTKRELLRLIMTIFDPLGLLSFYVMYAKIIFQETWRSGCGWDQPIPDEQQSKWSLWLQLLPEVATLKIPRRYLKADFKRFPDFEVHTFVDASEDGYAAVSYLRCTDGDRTDCILLGSKTRVAPLKMMSVPRLELQAAVLGARLATSLAAAHSIDMSTHIFWSDSRTVLAWIRSDHRRFRPFVSFRVSEILELTELTAWRWIPSADNVADDATKWQKTPDFSNQSRWLNGPSFLKQDPRAWPQEETRTPLLTNEELRPQFVGLHTEPWHARPFLSVESERFDSWQKLVRVTTAVLHYAHIWRDATSRKILGDMHKL